MVSVCFSKGLGAPVGSAVTGSAELVAKARKIRKMLGGGMRQVGIIAAAALYAVENNYKRLSDDHVNAKKLAEGLQAIDGISIDIENIQTNIVVFDIEMPIDRFIKAAAEKGLLVVPFGINRIRIVPHLGTTENDISEALKIISEVISGN
jgi:threonine aldolase